MILTELYKLVSTIFESIITAFTTALIQTTYMINIEV